MTGGAAGIGRALTLRLAEKGAKVAMIDVNKEGMAETIAMTQSLTGEAHAFVADIADFEQVSLVAEAILQEMGQIDILINNAGVAAGRVNTIDIDFADWKWSMDINFWGTVHCTKAFLPALLKRPKAAIANVASAYSMMGVSKRAIYCSTKFAVRGYTESLRQELRPTKVQVTSVLPGMVRTDITRHARGWQDANDQEIAAILQNRFARTTPEQAAKKILWGIRRRKNRVLVGPDAKAVDFMARVFPAAYDWISDNVLTKYEAYLMRKELKNLEEEGKKLNQ